MEFYEDNPDEELTKQDMRIKFGFTDGQLKFAVERLMSLGQIRRINDTYRRARG